MGVNSIPRKDDAHNQKISSFVKWLEYYINNEEKYSKPGPNWKKEWVNQSAIESYRGGNSITISPKIILILILILLILIIFFQPQNFKNRFISKFH